MATVYKKSSQIQGARTAKRQMAVQSDLFAAVDLGSNSFRMEIGRVQGRGLVREHYVKHTVRLGAGLDASNNLTAEAIEKGAASLAEFAKLLKGIPPENIRAVATNTLRVAKNPEAFLLKAEKALGHPIEIIPGREEARLIYAGVAHLLPYSESPRLVVDIGGGSTEMIVGRGFSPMDVESFKLGSVSETRHHFADGRLTEEALTHAEIAVVATLEEGKQRFNRAHWSAAYGSSGTASAIAEIAKENKWSDGTITKAVLTRLRKILIEAGRPERVKLVGLKPDRVPVLAGGYVVLAGVFKAMDIESLQPARGSLRHGVLYQLLDRRMGSDAREASLMSLARRLDVDLNHAQQVQQHALRLYAGLQASSKTDPADAKLLGWAALAHELGFAVSHHNYHRHGAYILSNGDLNGFAPNEQQLVADLVLAHRGNLAKVAESFGKWPDYVQQVLALRIAAILCHAREALKATPLQLRMVRGGAKPLFELSYSKGFETRHPQTMHLLREEAQEWALVGVRLVV
jgi:exopolyphosphatase / guanosine-5'-triphosphate,3'-diphosphate pyrophosphatase